MSVNSYRTNETHKKNIFEEWKWKTIFPINEKQYSLISWWMLNNVHVVHEKRDKMQDEILV